MHDADIAPADETAARAESAAMDLPQLRREVARHAGFPAATAEHFASTGMAQAGPVAINLRSLAADGEGSLLLSTSAERPPHVEDATWNATMLLMNAECMVMMPGAFGLDDAGRAWLALRLEGQDREPEIVATWLQGAVQVWLNLCSDAKPGEASPDMEPGGKQSDEADA